MYKDLLEKKWVTAKAYTKGVYAGLSVLKYSRSVFYNNLFKEDPRLEELRGLVVDTETNKVVMRPFKKVYNYGENDAGKHVPNDTLVELVYKVNGFMAQVTRYQGKVLVGTTGTLDSEYAVLAKEVLNKQLATNSFRGFSPTLDTAIPKDTAWTYLFEICDPSDPHIVYEEPGAYLIGMRETQSGRLATERELDLVAGIHGYLRPKHFVVTMEDAKELRKTVSSEGFMLRSLNTGEYICKMKSTHYLSKKALMRMSKRRVNAMFTNPKEFKKQIDEEFYSIVDYVIEKYSLEEYLNIDAQQRRTIFEEFYTSDEYMKWN